MEHTKEPWEWSEHKFNAPPFEGTLDNECGIYPPDGEIGPVAIASGKNDARRIVACVNACAGVATEELEQSGFVAGLVERLEEKERQMDALLAQRNELEKLCNYNERLMQELLQQRDELAAALEKLARLGNEPHQGNSIGNQIARDALAKVGADNTATDGHCTLGEDLCNCGGDVPAVRADCANWKRHNAEITGRASGPG